jgi:oligopeptide/dipeptide ABC transporter ATP-binding protein
MTLLTTTGLTKRFPIESGLLRRERGQIHAVDGVDLSVERGTTLGLVGESGSGKSTLGRLIVRLLDPTSGRIEFDGVDITNARGDALRRVRRRIQIVFQDPHSAFDPSASLLTSIREPMQTHLGLSASEQRTRAAELVELVGLEQAHLARFPSELSGGQLQRLAIARALAPEPELMVLDEPVSSLDVSTQAQVVNLLRDLRQRVQVAFIFIAHDLAVVRHVSDRIAVMYLGRVVENGPADSVYRTPRHPYSEALLSAIPIPSPARQRSRNRIVLRGDIPSPADPPPGCNFHTRCPYAMDICREVDPLPFSADDGTTVFCHLHTTGPELNGKPLTTLRRARQPDAPASNRYTSTVDSGGLHAS